ncbi:TPA: Ig-like domain-containing protein [Bacillus toyonensis]|uniref:Ig-like domain-containing protein n=1 Tax=Bacillus cereus group TaxID=86661 RepID=UPI000BFD1AF0|nr:MULTISPECIES: Ig-like domain-containing protein [Bacillus cereus group]PHA81593.1 hypothetical protein COE74_27875 [Bacillus toyonensis]QWI06078.1 hypothetical protein EXW54_15825 [Bacillus toyonensis]QWI46908.1 hypothetical protein EXW55_28985 [Bacillus mycoides]HDR7383806.1 Ig-like domain-containing protein [Bacillus toyonensis]
MNIICKINKKQPKSLILDDGPLRLPPNGKETNEFTLTVTDTAGRPVPNDKLTLKIEPINPNGPEWRSEDGVVNRYPQKAQGNVRNKIREGLIRLLGTLDKNEVTTDENGIAKVIYRVSDIGGNESTIGQEKFTVTFSNGESKQAIIEIGYDFLVEIPIIDKGLQIDEKAMGRYVHKDIAPALLKLGEEVKTEGWKYPVTITAGTLRWGGLYPPHSTHRTGEELDIRLMTCDGKGHKYTDCEYDREKTQLLVNKLITAGAKTILFDDKSITGVTQKPAFPHLDHLHASFK